MTKFISRLLIFLVIVSLISAITYREIRLQKQIKQLTLEIKTAREEINKELKEMTARPSSIASDPSDYLPSFMKSKKVTIADIEKKLESIEGKIESLEPSPYRY